MRETNSWNQEIEVRNRGVQERVVKEKESEYITP